MHSNSIVSVLNRGATALRNGNEHIFSFLIYPWAIVDSMFLGANRNNMVDFRGPVRVSYLPTLHPRAGRLDNVGFDFSTI